MAGSFKSRRRALAPGKVAPSLPKVPPGHSLRKPAPPLRGPRGPEGANGAAGATGPVGPTGATGAAAPVGTGSDTGYYARLGYVHASSARLGTTFAGVTLQANATWTVAADVPDGNLFVVDLFAGTGGGAGGGAGITGSGFQSFGGSSAGAAHCRREYSRADILAALPIVIAAGLGGVGGVGGERLGTAGGGETPGTSGSPGTESTFGSLCAAYPGGIGVAIDASDGTQSVGSSGGGTQSAGVGLDTTTQQLGGRPGASITHASGENGAPSGAATSTTGFTADWGGASSPGASSGGASHFDASESYRGGSAGGRGGRWSTGTSAQGGGTGGGVGGATPAGAAATGTGAVSIAGGDGDDGADGNLEHGGAGGAGGGGAKIGSAANPCTAQGGDGGDGGFPGGGAGGGGDGCISTGSLASDIARGGDGGRGGDGVIVVTIYR